MKDSKSIIYKECPVCHHGKAIENTYSGLIKCAKCKRVFKDEKSKKK